MKLASTTNAANDSPPADMVWIPGGAFRMGSEDFFVSDVNSGMLRARQTIACATDPQRASRR